MSVMQWMPFCLLMIESEEDRVFMETLFTEHWRLMYRCAWKVVHSIDEVEDVVGNSCLALIRRIDRLRAVDPKVYPAYIMATVRNEALMMVRRKGIEQRAHERLWLWNQAEEAVLENSVEDQVLRNCSLESMKRALSRLPEKDQVVLRMRFFDGASDHEVAEALGMRLVSIRSRRGRALEKLYKLLEEESHE